MLLGARTKKQLRLASVDPSSRLPSDFQLVHRTAEGRFLSTSGFSPSFFPLFFEASFYATMVLLPGQSTSGEYFSLPPSLYSLPSYLSHRTYPSVQILHLLHLRVQSPCASQHRQSPLLRPSRLSSRSSHIWSISSPIFYILVSSFSTLFAAQ